MTHTADIGAVKAEQDSSRVAERTFVFPLTFQQQGLWFLDQLEPGIPMFFTTWSFRMSGALQVETLEKSINEIVRRHEVLRTTFATREGQPVQVIAPSLYVSLPIVDLTNLAESDRESEARRQAEAEAQRPMDLHQGPLVRGLLLRLAEHDHVLLFSTHHIIFDDWSIGILLRKLGALYQAFAAGKASPLTELPLQYADFAVWQHQLLEGEHLERLLSYWKRQLANTPANLGLPTDRPRPPVQSFRCATQPLSMPKELTEDLKALSRREGVTLFMTLVASFQTLLCRYSEQQDIVVGTPVANRTRVEFEGLIGLFANTLALRTDLSGNPSFRELLGRVKEVVLGAYAHQDMPFEKLVEELRPERSLSRNPLFQVVFSLQNAPRQAFQLKALTLRHLESDCGTTKFDLSLFMTETAEGLQGRWDYSTDLFDRETVERMIGHFRVLLESAVADPEQPISQLPLLSGPERQQLSVKWNDTMRDYRRDSCLHELISEQAERRPEAVAVACGPGQLSYGQLNQQANQVAHFLRERGVGPGQRVGIYIERSLQMMVGLLGILKSGAAYVPMDAAYPAERLRMMLEDAQVPVLLTQAALHRQLPELQAEVVSLDADWERMASHSTENPCSGAGPEDLAYIIFTSGSTGRPKGVQVPHRAVVNLLTFMQRELQLGEREVIPALASFAFDMCIPELYLPLLVGGTMVMVEQEVAVNGEELRAVLEKTGATVVHATPTTWRLLFEAGFNARGRKRVIGAEPLPRDLFLQLMQNDQPLYNFYGPTETTVWSTFHCFNSREETITVGRPLANTQVYILDPQGQPVPIGVPGEIHIGGDGVTYGYLKLPELTAEKFIPDSFSPKPGVRMYRTGDLGRYLKDGRIEFLGRMDHQVKVRGFRIELGEIEVALSSLAEVEQSVVVVREDQPGDKRLVAYLVAAAGHAIRSAGELRSYLKAKLPAYMVPAAYVTLKKLPLTPNGKVDRRALPAPEQSSTGLEQTYTTPRTPVEAVLARMWAEVLRVERVGVQNDFFELGGHSLLAARLMHRIEQVFGKRLPLSMLLQTPTIEGLASVLRRDDFLPVWSSLVPLQPNGSQLPFFCVHGIGGNVVGFQALARHLGPNQPFYGLQAQGLDGKHQCHTRVEDMAAHYISEMRAIQPHGPYLVGGLSFGGWVALEMAIQLQDKAEKVGLVALLDSNPGHLRSLTSSLVDVFLSPTKHKLMYLLPETARLGIRRRMVFRSLPKTLRDVQNACVTAERNYHLRRYTGCITLFRASTAVLRGSKDPQEGWRGFAGGGLEVHEIAGHHVDIITEPHVHLLAKKLAACLCRVGTPTADSKGPLIEARSVAEGSFVTSK